MSVSPVTDVSYPSGERLHQTSIASRRWAPTSDIDSVSFAESLSDSDVDDQRCFLLSESDMSGHKTKAFAWTFESKAKTKLSSRLLESNADLSLTHSLSPF